MESGQYSSIFYPNYWMCKNLNLGNLHWLSNDSWQRLYREFCHAYSEMFPIWACCFFLLWLLLFVQSSSFWSIFLLYLCIDRSWPSLSSLPALPLSIHLPFASIAHWPRCAFPQTFTLSHQSDGHPTYKRRASFFFFSLLLSIVLITQSLAYTYTRVHFTRSTCYITRFILW